MVFFRSRRPPEPAQEASGKASKPKFRPGEPPGTSRARFWSLRGFILEPPGVAFLKVRLAKAEAHSSYTNAKNNGTSKQNKRKKDD